MHYYNVHCFVSSNVYLAKLPLCSIAFCAYNETSLSVTAGFAHIVDVTVVVVHFIVVILNILNES